MVIGLYLHLLFLLQVAFHHLIFLERRLHIGFHLLLAVRTGFHNFLQFEALKLVQTGTGEVATIDKHAHYLLIIGHGTVERFQHLALEFVLQLLVVLLACPFWLGHDDGLEQIAVLYHGRFLNLNRILLQLEFYFGRLHILSVGKHDDFLASAGNVDAALLIKTRQVAGMEEAILVQHLCRFFGTVVISLHDIGSLSPQLIVYYLALNRGQRQSGTAGYDVTGTGERNHGSGLGHAIALQDIQS